MLGALDNSFVSRIIEQLAAQDGASLMQLIAEADEQFPDYRRLLDELASTLTRIAVFQTTRATDLDAQEHGEVDRLAGLLTPEDTQLYYQMAITGKRDLLLAPDPRVGTEMTLLRMLAFRPPAATAPAGGRSTSARPARAAQAATPSAAPAEQATSDAGLADWNRLVGQLALSGLVRLLAANCAFDRRDGDCIHLSLDKRNSSMLSDERIRELAAALTTHIGETVTVSVAVSNQQAVATPVETERQAEAQKAQSTREALEQDAGVAEMQRLFDARVQDVVPAGDAAGEKS